MKPRSLMATNPESVSGFVVNGFFRVLVLFIMALGLFSNSIPALSKATTEQEAALLQRLEERIKQDLLKGPWLQEQIERGIQEHFKREKAAKVAARAEQEKSLAEKAKSVRPIDKIRDHIYGNPTAEVSLIEFSDFDCPYCKAFHPTARQLVDGSHGKVNWIFRHFPNPRHVNAQKDAEAAECSAELGGNEGFWKYADALYARNQGGTAEHLTQLAQSHGLNANDFRECLDSGRYVGRVKDDLAEGMRIGITGTPGSILRANSNGRVAIRIGNSTGLALSQDIERLVE